MKKRGLLLILAVTLVLAGCAHQVNFPVDAEFRNNKSVRIGVVVTSLPVAHRLRVGPHGVYDVLINDPEQVDLDNYLASQDLKSINKLADSMVMHLTKRGYMVKRIPGYLNVNNLPRFKQTSSNKGYFAEEDFWVHKEKWGVEKVVVLSVEAVGMVRGNPASFPVVDVNGYAQIRGRIVNLATNQLEWNQTVRQTIAIDEINWNKHPQYPGVARAVMRAYNQAQVIVFNHFTNQ